MPNLRHLEWFHDHVRIEQMFFEGVHDPSSGALHPDPATPGHGLTTRDDILRRYQVGDTVHSTAPVPAAPASISGGAR